METDVALAVSGCVMTLVQVIKATGIPHEKGVWIAALLSLLGVALYGLTFEPIFERILIWKYFTAFCSVLLSAMGAFGLVRQAASMVTDVKGAGTALKESITGTGDGSTKE